MKKLFLIIALVVSLCAQNTEDLLKNAKIYEPNNRALYLGTSIGIMLGASFLVAGGLYLMPESVSNWNRSDFKNIFANYRRKVGSGPVIDKDALWLNYVAHPYVGAWYYLQPRIAGYSWAESAFFSFMASSFFWEYGLEGFAEIPSWQDLIITPAAGAILGEGFYRLIRYIWANDDKFLGSILLGKILLWVMDPIGQIIRDCGLGNLIGLQNKNTLVTTPIIPTRGGGCTWANLSFLINLY